MTETATHPVQAPSKAADPILSGDMRAAGAMGEIMTGALTHLRANQPSAASGDVEGVHQIRVAVRRLRSALVLFRPHLEPHAAGRFETELQRTGRVFGDARDWDVFCTETLVRANADCGAEVELLLAAAEPRRDAAHWHLRAELDGPAFAHLCDGLAEWADRASADPAGVGDGRMRRKLERVAPDLLDRLARKVDRRGRHLRTRPAEELHALRKSLKKLRYGMDFLAGLYGRKSVDAFRHDCKALQETLGRINDSAAAARLGSTLDAGDRPDLAPAVGALVQWAERSRAQSTGRLPQAWRRFRDAKRPWR